MAHAWLAMSAGLTRPAPVARRASSVSTRPRFAARRVAARRVATRRVAARASSEESSNSDAKQAGAGAGLKAVWYGAEAVGKVVGATKTKDAVDDAGTGGAVSKATTTTSDAGPFTRERVLELLKEDYDTN